MSHRPGGAPSLRHRTYWNDEVREWAPTHRGYQHIPDGGEIEFGEFSAPQELRPLAATCRECGTTWRRPKARKRWQREEMGKENGMRNWLTIDMHRAEKIAAVLVVGMALSVVTVNARTARKPPRLPRAAPVTLNVGDAVVINGQTYQVGYSLIPVGTTPNPTPNPNPTPTPSPTAISGIRNLATGQLVTSATAGTLLQMEGTGLGSGGRLQLGGRFAANPTSWTDTAIQFTAPDPGPAAFTGGWSLYWPNGNQLILKATSGAFTLLPAGSPAPTPTPTPTPLPMAIGPQARALTDMSGAPVGAISVGMAYQVTGDHFGSSPGHLSLNASPATVTQWTDGKLLFVAPANYGADVGLWVTVRRADGVTSSMKLR